MGVIETLIANVDSMILGFVHGSYGSLSAPAHIFWRLMFIVFIAVYGYKVIISGRFSASDLLTHCIKIVVLLIISTQWSTFLVFVYNLVTDLPSDIAGQMLQGSAGTLNSSAQPEDAATANNALSVFFDRGMEVVQKILEGAGLTDIGLYLYAGSVFIGTVGFVGYAGMLIVLSKIAVAILLAVSPVFILLLIFPNTRGLFEGWFRTLLNYACIPIFVYTLLAFLLSLAERPLQNLEQHSGTMQELLNGVAPYILVTFISILLLMQIMNMAASITGGLSLSTMGGAAWGIKKVQETGARGWNIITALKQKTGQHVAGKTNEGRTTLARSLKSNKKVK